MKIMGFKEDVSKLERFFKKTAFVLWISAAGFFGFLGFLFGGAAYLLKLDEAGITIPDFYFFLFRLFDKFTFLFILFGVYALAFWALRKFYVPRHEKRRILREQKQEEKTRKIIRDEIKKSKGKKK